MGAKGNLWCTYMLLHENVEGKDVDDESNRSSDNDANAFNVVLKIGHGSVKVVFFKSVIDRVKTVV